MGTLFIGTTHCLNKVNIPIYYMWTLNSHFTTKISQLHNQLTTTRTLFQTPTVIRLIKNQRMSSGELAESERFWWRA